LIELATVFEFGERVTGLCQFGVAKMPTIDPAPDANLIRRNLVKGGVRLASLAAASLFGVGGAHAALCFMRGTSVLTASGERKVEDLAIGDLLVTQSGAVRPILWVGRYGYKRSDVSRPWVADARPVRVAKSALAPNVPDRDLFITQAHALFIDGALVPAGSLLNGDTISLYAADEFDALEYFHIKLETHDVIFAANAPCETLLGVTEVAANFAEYTRLYGAPQTDEAPCHPLLAFNGGRSELASRLRSAISPFIDRRTLLDAIRDRLEARADAMKANVEG
jgi:hypothetical protein